MNTFFNIELYGQAEKNRVLDGIRLLILKSDIEIRKTIDNPTPDRWKENKIGSKIRHRRYLESLYLRIKLTKGKKPKLELKNASTRSNQAVPTE